MPERIQWSTDLVSDLPEAGRFYPVIVEETRQYVLWIEAESPTEAVQAFDYDPHDPDRGSMYSFDWTSRTPDRWDWANIERPASEGDWRGTQADAHVQSWRSVQRYHQQQAAKAACTAAGHPFPADATGPLRWADYCGTCGSIDPSERTAVAS